MEKTLHRLNAADAFAAAEKLWKSENARTLIRDAFARSAADFEPVVLVLDDDPTGVQTVHDVDVVTGWDEETLYEMFREDIRMFFVLTNSRGMSAHESEKIHREIAQNALTAARRAGKKLMMVSRGDSTLRGHYPLETDTLRAVLEADGPFSGEVLCPFFREGGRFTLNGVHYVQEGAWLTPAGQTEFAQDKTFGYTQSFLPAYIEEKSGGAVRAQDVIRITLKELRSMDWDALRKKLLSRPGFCRITADALEETDVQALAKVLMDLMKEGRRYLFRSAAALPKVFGRVDDRPLLERSEMIDPRAESGGLVLVGSHVKKTTDQLNCLRESPLPLTFIEFDVTRHQQPGGLDGERLRTVRLAEEAMRAGRTAVVYTSRQLLAPQNLSPEEMLALSVRISDAVTGVVSSLSLRPRFLIAKGGITSSDVGTKALRVRRARVLGQAAPGIPVWKTGSESLFPGLSYIIFPGNVGDVDTLRHIVEALA